MDSKLKLKGGVKGGLLDFDGSTVVTYGNNLYIPSLFGGLDMEFKLWLDNDEGFLNSCFILCPSVAGDDIGTCFSSFLYESSIYIGQKVLGDFQSFSIKNLDNQTLDCKIRKSEIGQSVEFFSINGNNQTPGAILHVVGSNVSLILGDGPNAANDFETYNFDINENLKNAAIWDVKITEVSTGTLKHYWKGYPEPDSSLAWKDQAGDLDLWIEPMVGAKRRFTPLTFYLESHNNLLKIKNSNNSKLNMGI